MRNTSHLRRQHLQKSAKRRRQASQPARASGRPPARAPVKSIVGLSWVAGAGGCVLPSSEISVVALMLAAGMGAAGAQQTLDPITVLATKTIEKTIEALAMVSSVRQEQLDQIQPKRVAGHVLRPAERLVPRARRHAGDLDQHPRPAGLRPRRGGDRRRAAELPALRPQRQRPVLPRARARRRGRRGARSGRQHLRLGRDRRRRVVPHQGCAGRAAAGRAHRRADEHESRLERAARPRLAVRRRAPEREHRSVRRRHLSLADRTTATAMATSCRTAATTWRPASARRRSARPTATRSSSAEPRSIRTTRPARTFRTRSRSTTPMWSTTS